MKKVALFAFDGEVMCFVHVLLNALDLKAKGNEVALIVEGASVKLPPELAKPDNPLHGLYLKVVEAGLIKDVCRACSMKLGVIQAVEALGLPVTGDMQGHVPMSAYMEKGFDIITF